MTTTAQARQPTPSLPSSRGPVSDAVLAAALHAGQFPRPPVDEVDPLGDDLQLALYCCYELHYRGFAEVDDAREWDPDLLALRGDLEKAFVRALREQAVPGSDVAAEVDRLLIESTEPAGASQHLRRDGELWQLREYVAQRSLYHLKEADPQTFVIPRLHGQAKAALVTVQHDEYGAGEASRMHSLLFATMMSELGLSDAYGAYLDTAPAEALAEVNFMSLCGLHRSLRAALIGQFASIELTSSPGADRLVKAMRRLGCSSEAIRFYAEHVEADAVHEQLVRHKVLAPMLAAEPELATDVVFGIRASGFLASRLEQRMLRSWQSDDSSMNTGDFAEQPQ